MLGKPRILSFSPSYLIDSIRIEHSCNITYVAMGFILQYTMYQHVMLTITVCLLCLSCFAELIIFQQRIRYILFLFFYVTSQVNNDQKSNNVSLEAIFSCRNNNKRNKGTKK